MYIFEAIYENIITEKQIIKTIDMDSAPNASARDCFLYATDKAFDLAGENEELYTVRLVAC